MICCVWFPKGLNSLPICYSNDHKKKKKTVEIAQTVATQPRQLHYSNNLSKKKKITAPSKEKCSACWRSGGSWRRCKCKKCKHHPQGVYTNTKISEGEKKKFLVKRPTPSTDVSPPPLFLLKLVERKPSPSPLCFLKEVEQHLNKKK